MTKIGIDFSMNCVGVTIQKDGEPIKFCAIMNRYELSASAEFDIKKVPQYKLLPTKGLDIFVLFDRKPNSLKKPKSSDKFSKMKNLNDWHKRHMGSCDDMLSVVKGVLDEHIDDTTIVAMEHLITRNGGNATVQIVEFTKSLKDWLWSKTKHLYVIPAPSIKEIAGGGGYQKADMLNAFIKDAPEHPFVTNVSSGKSVYVKTKKDIIKPIDDVVDSFYVLKALEELILF
jgi:hypothetical protein